MIQKEIPKDALGYLFSFFDAKLLATAGAVSKSWNTVSKRDELWSQLLSKMSFYKKKDESPHVTIQRIFNFLKTDIYELPEYAQNLDDAKLIFETPELAIKMDRPTLTSLAKKDPIIAEMILTNKKLLKLLDENAIVSIIDNDRSIVLLLTIPKLATKISPTLLSSLVNKYYEVLETSLEDNYSQLSKEAKKALYFSSLDLDRPFAILEKEFALNNSSTI